MLQRDYFFEFAGMPQSGKTTVMETMAHFLKRHRYSIEEYRGGSRFSPLYNAHIADLNLWLASRAVEFVISAIGREKVEHRIYLLDRGLIDRFIFTDALLRHGKVDKTQAERISAFLMLPHLLEKLDGVFTFVTSPEIALYREYTGKPEQPEGEVMNAKFLSTLYSATIDGYRKAQELHVHNVQLIDTERDNDRVEQTVELVLSNIHNIITTK